MGTFKTALKAAEAYARAAALQQEGEEAKAESGAKEEEVTEEQKTEDKPAKDEDEEDEDEGAVGRNKGRAAAEGVVQEVEGLQLHLSSRSKTGRQSPFNPTYALRLRHSPAVTAQATWASTRLVRQPFGWRSEARASAPSPRR